MIPVSKAKEIVLNNLFKPDIISIPITESVATVLQETICADRDFPPFDRVSMDGIAIDANQWKSNTPMPIEGMQAAGSARQALHNTRHCIEVMTGAMLPQHTNAVIPYEDIRIEEKNGHRIAIISEKPEPGKNVHRQGIDRKNGELLMEKGALLGPPEIAVLASVGKNMVKVSRFPKIALITTGDELVDIEATPLPYQIRKSNVYALDAALRGMRLQPEHFHFADEQNIMKAGIAKVLSDFDVLVLSGGVSKGKKDFVPEALEACGVKTLFHRVQQKPGKPFWFGAAPTGKIVFALPGNPVSTFMCFFKYIKPWLLKSLRATQTPELYAILQEEIRFEPPLTYFVQGKMRHDQGVLKIFPMPGQGSGDFASLLPCDGFIELPAQEKIFRKGDYFPFIPFR